MRIFQFVGMRVMFNKPKGLKVAKEDQRSIGSMVDRLDGQWSIGSIVKRLNGQQAQWSIGANLRG